MEQQEWNIRSRSDTCSKTGRAFEDGETFVTELVWNENGYERYDWSEQAYDEQGARPDAVSTWRSVYRLPPPKEEEALKKETAESLLRKLMETEQDTRTNAIFVLAVMLERKRILKEQSVERKEDGALTRFYEHKDSGETFIIVDPELSLTDLQHVQEEVVVLLGGKPPEKKTIGDKGDEGDEEDEFEDEDEDEDEDDNEEKD